MATSSYAHLSDDAVAGVHAYVARKRLEEPQLDLWAEQLADLDGELDRRGIRRDRSSEANPETET